MKAIKGTRILSLVAACALWIAATEASAQDTAVPQSSNIVARLETDATDSSTNALTEPADQIENGKGVRHEAIVVFGKDVELKAGDSAEVVVVIGGSAKILGKCDECVVIGGDLEIAGEVRNSAVVVLGTLRALKDAVLGGEVVGVGGGVEISEGATVRQRPVEVNFSGLNLEWLKKWLVHCVLKMRPLAPQVGWVWPVAGVFFLVYLLIAVAFPRPVQACVDELTRRPATTFLTGLLMKLLFPVLTIVLIMTGVGLLVVPFLLAAWVVGFVVGKVAILEYFGGKLGRAFGAETKPLLALLIGTIIITLLYIVPFVGLITFGVISLWGLGAAVTAMFTRFRRERPTKPVVGPPSPESGPTPPQEGVPPITDGGNIASDSAMATTAIPPSAPPNLPPSLAFPRASFWQRMGAAILDVAFIFFIIMLVANMLRNRMFGPPFAFIIALFYFSGMWAWKGTTIGGIVLKLKVARIDGGPVTFLVAIVRGIAAAFSALVLFLGFFWIGWDRDKQAWHDKIVGTVVLRMPYSTALVCL